jgi:2'-5' RNA ligase
MIRLFAALSAPLEIIEGLERRQTGLTGARWRPGESLHVTLRFFGEVNETVAGDLDDALAAIRQSPFDLSLEGVGAFADAGRPTAVWAGVAPSEPMNRLAAKCETAARKVGLKADARAFRPHLTLAYLRDAPQAKVADWIAENNLLRSPAWTARRFVLYSSSLGQSGSRYQVEREYPLQ